MTADLSRWVTRDSPGRLGEPEVHIDASALDVEGGLDPDLVRYVLDGGGGGPWIGREVRCPGSGTPDARYMVVSRRTSTANLGRPYYVLVRQDKEGA